MDYNREQGEKVDNYVVRLIQPLVGQKKREKGKGPTGSEHQ